MKADENIEVRQQDAKDTGPSDEALMARYVKGDADAMTEIVNRHGNRLFGYLVRLTGSREKAEDAYQEVFIRVIRSASKYKPSSRFTAWLYTIARNITIDMARRDKHRVTESLDAPAYQEGETSRVETMANDGADPEQNLMVSEMKEALETAIGQLAPEQKEVLLLRERAGLSFKEIASITGAPLNTVKTRMHYALGHLRKNLDRAALLGENGK